MFRKNFNFVWVSAVIMGSFLSVAAGPSVVRATEVASSPDLQDGEYARISGVASFEHHRTLTPLGTLTPLALCEEEEDSLPCPQSKSYWTLVIQGRGARYELNRKFGEGSETAPESVELQSTVIRPGSQVSMQVRIDSLSRGYAIVSDPREVAIEGEIAAFYGFSCHSVAEAQPLYVDVIQVTREGEYSMRVQAAGPTSADPARTLAQFAGVSLSVKGELLAFEGKNAKSDAELSIDQGGDRLNDFVSSLKIVTRSLGVGLEIPVGKQVRLACNPTR